KVLAPVSQANHRSGSVGNVFKFFGSVFCDGAEHFASSAGWRGENDSACFSGFLASGRNAPYALSLIVDDVFDRRVQTHASFGKPARDTIDEFLHAAGQSDEQTPAGAAAALPMARPSSLLRPRRPNDAALGPFHFLEARHRCGQAELVRIRRVDAADQKLGDAFQSFDAESTVHE